MARWFKRLQRRRWRLSRTNFPISAQLKAGEFAESQRRRSINEPGQIRVKSRVQSN
jgi:hypothetical protein